MFVMLKTDIITHLRLRFLSRPCMFKGKQISDQSSENIEANIYKYL
jgi:hypothetical protein